jgi:outer membrane protein OmpA-like peptidoglycan-associated protein
MTIAIAFLALAAPARAQSLDDIRKQATDQVGSAAKSEANKSVVDKVNARLLAEGRKNQCSFKTDSDELAPGCDAKAKKLASTLIDVKKQLSTARVASWKFVVSGHTDTRGDAGHNKQLSQKRADVMVRELVARGVPKDDIESVGLGAERPLVKPDDTPAKQARNRRYEIQVRI